MTSDPAAKDGRGHMPANSWPSDLSERIAVEIRAYVLERNVGLTASVAAQVATGYFSSDRDRLRERVKELENALQKIANHDGVSEIIARTALSKSPK